MRHKEAFALICEFFDYDTVKAARWMRTPNPVFSGIEPMNIERRKLLRVVRQMLSENEPPVPVPGGESGKEGDGNG